jgi:hypothetical protein
MDLIILPRLRLKELQSLGESSLEICMPITEVEPATQAVSIALAAFKQSMLKEEASAAVKKTIDKSRDRLNYGLMHHIKAEQYFPHTKVEVQETLIKLVAIAYKYGTKLSRLPFNEESAGIDNMITELNQLNPEALSEMGIARWIPLIGEANTAFKAAAHEYVANSVEADELDSATSLAPALINALEGLYTLLFAHVKITNSDTLVTAYNQLDELVSALK